MSAPARPSAPPVEVEVSSPASGHPSIVVWFPAHGWCEHVAHPLCGETAAHALDACGLFAQGGAP